MELGEKLKQARLAAGLSQRKLCGSVITRNMLSQIENGTARPSMDTLRYLAGVLEKPMGYFLEEENGSQKENPMALARQAYRNGEYGHALELLSQLAREDEEDEQGLLELLSLLALAEQAIGENRRPYARKLLDAAARAEEKTIYVSDELRQRRLILLARMEPDSAAELAALLPSNDEALLLRARGALQRGDMKLCGDYLNACEKQDDSLWNLIAGEMYFKSQDFPRAALHYRAAEEVFFEECVGPLEQCYLAMEDYRLAYEYACKRRKEGTPC